MTKLPAPRKYLSADALFGNIRRSFHDIPDPRTGEPDVSLPDALMSGLAVFAFKDPSLLARQGPGGSAIFGWLLSAGPRRH